MKICIIEWGRSGVRVHSDGEHDVHRKCGRRVVDHQLFSFVEVESDLQRLFVMYRVFLRYSDYTRTLMFERQVWISSNINGPTWILPNILVRFRATSPSCKACTCRKRVASADMPAFVGVGSFSYSAQIVSRWGEPALTSFERRRQVPTCSDQRS